MTNQERKQLTYLPAAALDAEILKRFGVEAETIYAFLDGHYVTRLPDDTSKEDVARINTFIDGFTAGILELRTRLEDKALWL